MELKKMIILLSAITLCGCADKPAENKAPTTTGAHYSLAAVQTADMEQTVKLPAQLAAYQEVTIFPKVNGYVENVFADIGSHVGRGQLLMTIDAPEVLQAVSQAREKFARAKSDYNINKEDYYRLKVASRTAGAIAPMDLATAKSKMESDSALSNAEKANWLMQQAMMSYLRVTAPFSGIITERNVHPGALVSAESKDKPMLVLKEVDHLRLQVDIPEALAVTLKHKDPVSFYLIAFPGREMKAYVSRISGNINVQYRTERMELDVLNNDGSLAPGMYADVILTARGNPNALTVPRSAVVTSTERKYCIAVRNGRSVVVNVETGIENNNKVEVVGNLRSDDKVIVNANDEIANGLKIN